MKKFKLIFFMSLMLILILGTTSEASTPTVKELKNFFDFVIKKEQDGELNYTYTLSNSQTIAEAFYNYTQNINYSLDNLVFVSADSAYKSGVGKVKVKGLVFICNNTFGHDGLDFLYIKKSYGTGYTYYYKNSSDNVFVPCFWIKNDGTFAFDNSFSGSTIDNYGGNDRLTINSNKSYIVNNFILTTVKTASFYYYDNNKYIPVLNNYNGFYYYDMYPKEPDIPAEPSGDTGTGGTTGIITNPSGDTTGKVDLSGIEQGIGAVKDAVNNVTNTIKDAFTFDSGDANEVMEDFKNTDLGLSQDLYDLNNQFFDLFKTQEMNDFIISWDGVNYQNVELIPSGEINFSALCRENEQIGKVKDYITLFAIVGSSLTLLKVIWNMLAELLGLNHTLMETDFGDAKMYTYEDNSYDVDTRAYLDSKRYNRRR